MPAREQYWKMFNFVLENYGKKVLEFNSYETVRALNLLIYSKHKLVIISCLRMFSPGA